MILIDLLQVDLHPVDLARELAVVNAEVLGHGGAGIPGQVGGFVARKYEGLGRSDASLADLCTVQIERNGAPLAQPTAIIRELHAYLVCARGDRLGSFDMELLRPKEVVAVFRVTILCV